MFKRMWNNYKKAHAAVVVQNALTESRNIGLFSLDPAFVANRLVGELWKKKTDVLEGKFGHRPHKLSIAAASLGDTIAMKDDWGANTKGIQLAFLKLMQEVYVNGDLYGLTATDFFVLEESREAFKELVEVINSSVAKQIGL